VTRLMLLALVLVLAGCGAEPPPVVVTVAPEPYRPAIPPECRTVEDPHWRDLPLGDADQEDGARNYRTNKGTVRDLRGLRKVCEAALAKLFPAP